MPTGIYRLVLAANAAVGFCTGAGSTVCLLTTRGMMMTRLGQVGASIVSKGVAASDSLSNAPNSVITSNSYDYVMDDLLSSDVPSSSGASRFASNKKGVVVGTVYNEDEDDDAYKIEPATVELWKSVENNDSSDDTTSGNIAAKKGRRTRLGDGNIIDITDSITNSDTHRKVGGYIDFSDLLSSANPNHTYGHLTPSRNGTASGGSRGKYIDFSDITNSSTDDYFDVLQRDSEIVLSSIREKHDLESERLKIALLSQQEARKKALVARLERKSTALKSDSSSFSPDSRPSSVSLSSPSLNHRHSPSSSDATIEQLRENLLSMAREKEESDRVRVRMEEEKRLAEESLQQQRRELEEMKAAILREKERVDSERRVQQKRHEEQSEREKMDLMLQIEIMKGQNDKLHHAIKESKEISENLLEKERSEKLTLVREIEEKNKLLIAKLINEQRETEERIQQEKDNLISTLKQMEREKEILYQKVEVTETKANEGYQLIEIQRNEFESALKSLAEEKKKLSRKLLDNQREMKLSSDGESDSTLITNFENEQRRLEEKIEIFEKEKIELENLLIENENNLKLKTKDIEKQLETEKNELKIVLERMENEKLELSNNLKMTENLAKEQNENIKLKLEREKSELFSEMTKMENEKRVLEAKIKLVIDKENDSKSAIDSSNEQNLQLQREREDLTKLVKAVEGDREELSLRLKASEETAALREQQMNEKLQKEKDELRQTVQRMKEELGLEREKHMQLQREKESLMRSQSVEQSPSANPLLAKKTSKSALLVRTMDIIPEHVQSSSSAGDLSFMDLGDDESVSSRSTIKSSSNNKGGVAVTMSDSVAMELKAIAEKNVAAVSSPAATAAAALDMTSILTSAVSKDGGGDEDEATAEKAAIKAIEDCKKDKFKDLPAPHAAAAGGDIGKLRMLATLEASLVQSFDSSHRSPLFYAVAYGQTEATKVLLQSSIGQSLVAEKDINGDTPLHAATSAGDPECLEILLSSCECDVNIRNNSEMGPTHLAKTVNCLEVLYKFGADMSISDLNGRSPLFVACATNRVECAEYLINCLDSMGETLMACDKRGDTPLHAAACNGSVDCVLLLLQYGVDPRVTNIKGLKPIDLAIKNKQKKCREVLAEYHLHYATSSDFDSVLFLATLQGHKKVKQRMNSPSHNSTGDGLDHSKVLSKVNSMFSLKANQSLRLQRWGEWLAYEDQAASKIYWYNSTTGSAQWEMPTEVVDLQKVGKLPSITSFVHASSLDASTTNAGKKLTSKMSMRLKKMGDWVKYKTENGQIFYYNELNGEFQWDNPFENAPSSSSGGSSSEGKKASKKQKASTNGDTLSSGVEGSKQLRKAESGEWKPFRDPTSNKIFWFNKFTAVSQWECPLEDILPAASMISNAQAKTFPTGSPTRDGGEDEEVVSVSNNDDLGI